MKLSALPSPGLEDFLLLSLPRQHLHFQPCKPMSHPVQGAESCSSFFSMNRRPPFTMKSRNLNLQDLSLTLAASIALVRVLPSVPLVLGFCKICQSSTFVLPLKILLLSLSHPVSHISLGGITLEGPSHFWNLVKGKVSEGYVSSGFMKICLCGSHHIHV